MCPTTEKLDEWGRQQGKAQAWARRAREGEFVKDPLETTDLDAQQRAFSILTGLMICTAFGKSTPAFLVQVTGWLPDEAAAQSIMGVLQAPALGLAAASIGSLVVCVIQAKEKNRDPFVWAIKGILGGPLTVRTPSLLIGIWYNAFRCNLSPLTKPRYSIFADSIIARKWILAHTSPRQGEEKATIIGGTLMHPSLL